MKRYGIYLIPFFIIIFTLTLIPSTGAPLSIVDSKHDLSYRTTNTVPIMSASGGTTEICVFCHTPHHSRTDAPLWNRSFSASSYQTYTSDVLAAMNYPGAENPNVGTVHVKTRICLSCHDGMIALGNLVNAPYGLTGDIAMTGPVGALVDGKLQPQTQGYIGTDLRDDHPVAIPYVGTDPELSSSTGTLKLYYWDGTKVKTINTPGASNFVECTSCHDAHDNQYGNFLAMSNQYSALCYACHNYTNNGKYGFLGSSHETATAVYEPPTGGTPNNLGVTVGEVKCMNCHFSHKASGTTSGVTPPNIIPANLTANPKAGYYLLTYQEEQSCYNNLDRWGKYPAGVTVCHGSSSSKNIQSLVQLSNAHKVGNHAFEHEATEARNPNWFGDGHVECADCHNPHTAGKSLHTKGTNTIGSSSALYGTGGVSASWGGSWSAPTYTYIQPMGVINVSSTGVSAEYQICIKCHSSYAWNTPPVPYPTWTDQGKEINSSNGGVHPVAGVNATRYQIPSGSWTSGSGFADGNTMYCSDCHNNSNLSNPRGPHGSNDSQGHILLANFDDTYSTTKTAAQPSSDLCFKCHEYGVYGSGTVANVTNVTGFMTGFTGTNLHTSHYNLATASTSSFAYRCVNCHTKIPHGYIRRGLIVINGDAESSTYAAQDAYGGARISNWTNPGIQSYAYLSCTTIPGCH